MSIVIITGASRGLGASMARHCARRGFGTIITYRTGRQEAEQLVAAIEAEGGKAAALPLDVSDIAGFPAFCAMVCDALASVWQATNFGALVNNAGHGQFAPIANVAEDDFDALFRVHLKGPFFLTQTLLPLMADGGHIVNVTSATTRIATAGVAPYAAFKGGLEVLTRYMAKEFGKRGIRANAIAPGAIRTDLGGGINAEFEAMLAGQTALGRIGEPDDVGQMVAGLLSDDNRWINAQTIEVAGGYII
ncbi:NAD(P)-dependent dehydrogenase (short-subunit alcohol dehydrogenase family) [Novosphingobium sp. SG751A]|uniref:SDR family NAD(P)-dependent oxidoreductase n=1 Tax=Novosphingobium sp. SG751A TaxID=2587000 RepID=UPI0015555A6C|nr:SDR family oxidoreductase [Novosphingobium sp. SG751A]NOW48759.1 NAD(P)-dependent dehydrogenase (short-subunit alcohol dehydrogenase family) [Novosphingobium sp. SG751A]